MEFNLFKLEKLKIYVYENEKRKALLIPPKKFEVMFNPESYSFSYENSFSKKQGINTSGRPSHYTLTKPSKLSLKIIIDGTGVSNSGIVNLLPTIRNRQDVYARVQEFLDLTFYMDGKIHEPKFLTVSWGDLTFKCRVTTVQVTYTLFDRNGKPLRAELDTSFQGDLETAERLKKENKTSPDLTHFRVVKAHDTLPLMCEEIYGTSEHYVKVASANKLDDFRNLKPGQELFFPPIEK